jgi:hypothetical protein
MRVQRNKQLLYDLEAGPSERFYLGLNCEQSEDITRSNSVRKNLGTKKYESSILQMAPTEMEILGPDFCAKRPVFLAPNQTKIPVNGTLNMQQLTASSYPAAKSQPNAPIKNQPAASKASHQQSAGATDMFNSS